jgi:hypothetical protein
MKLMIRKLTPKGLTRAIVTLAARTGNKLKLRKIYPALNRDNGEESSQQIRGCKQLRVRTTIRVETERLLVVRSERRSSR